MDLARLAVVLSGDAAVRDDLAQVAQLPDRVTFPAMADQVAGLMDQLGLEQVGVAAAGYSAAIAAALGALHPSRVSSAMLITVAAEVPELIGMFMGQCADQAEAEGMAGLADSLVAGAFPSGFVDREPEVSDTYRSLFLAREAPGFVAMLRALLEAGPVAIVGGAEDIAYTLDVHRAAAALLEPSIEPDLVPGAAHFPRVQNPPAMAQLMLQFFLQHGSEDRN